MTKTPLDAILLAYSESDFTNPHEAVLHETPRDCRGKFTHMGAQYWGFESKRHKTTAVLEKEQALSYDHDAHGWMLVGLKERAEIKEISISTKWYTGNQVRAASVTLRDRLTGKETKVIDRTPLNPDAEHHFSIAPTMATECYIECYSDGGFSQILFFGDVALEQPKRFPSLLEGCEISHVSNQHYGKPEQAVAGNRRELHMVGWESARTGFGERALFHLKKTAEVKEITVDTYLHRLNPPLTCHVFGVNKQQEDDIDALMAKAPRWKLVFDNGREVIPDDFRIYMLNADFLKEGQRKFKVKLHVEQGSAWKPILPFAPLAADRFHRFDAQAAGPVTHVLYMHYPNGGVHGLKMYGE